ncbi:MAG: macrolide transporter subunit MacA [Syntrophaceae bacterium PtaU1.Bin231]|nr:MAG: macrolide transporter subunit MacA [Syntrophaceae bacterium PtaU1.Bin231]
MKLKNKIVPMLAVAGLLLAVAVAFTSQKKTVAPKPVDQPAKTPFASNIGGAGIIEASTTNISVGTSIAGVVKDIYVKVGDRVEKGTPLFKIDDRELTADLAVKDAALVKARASLAEAQAALADYRSQYALVQNAADNRAVSVDDVQKRKNAVQLYEAKLESARAAVKSAETDVAYTKSSIDRLTVRASVTGEVLQVNIRPGEYAATGVLDTPLMRIGNLDNLYVRVDIDENDAWRFKPGSRAVVFIRGNSSLKADLAFVRVEPYITPKKSLTGSSSERVDTRVLQVLYSFARKDLPAYVGQQVDVSIESPTVSSSVTTTASIVRG